MARRVGDHRQRARVLVASHRAAHSPDNLEERLAESAEAVALADELDDRGWLLGPHVALLRPLRGGRPRVGGHPRGLRVPGRPAPPAVLRLARGRVEGDRGPGDERLALATRQTGREWGVPESSVEGIWGGQLFVLRYEQGRLAEVEPTIASFAESQPGLPVWRARLALLHCETGAPSQAQAHLESLAANLDALPRNVMWLSDMVPLALVAAALGDTSRSAAVFARLAPYTGRNSMTGLGSMGSVDLGLALLTATLGRLARGWP